MKNNVKIAYIGGGSRKWARLLMSDLAMEASMCGEVRLYDIDHQAAKDNVMIGNKLGALPEAKSKWNYVYAPDLASALTGVDFVVISILPATFKEMASDVHVPEKYGVFQTVGDTTGPGGIVRALRTIPLFVEFAKAIETYAKNAWVLNFTNPMTLCVQSLYEGFPGIKVVGNCHEVFHTQSILAKITEKHLGIQGVKREDIDTTVAGINHFTWITKASYQGVDLLPVYDKFVKENEKEGFYNKEESADRWFFTSHEKVKFDLYLKYGAIAAAGDRHLAEFMPLNHYIMPESRREAFKFGCTPVSWRENNKDMLLAQTARLVSGEEDVKLEPSGEEGVRQIKALLGLGNLVTNCNVINHGQVKGLPLGSVVESNALFRNDRVEPIFSGSLPLAVTYMTCEHINKNNLVMEAYRKKDLSYALRAIQMDPLTAHLSEADIKAMFDTMIQNTKDYLGYYFN